MLHFEKDPAVQMLNNKETEDDTLVGGEVASSEPSASASSEPTSRLIKSTKSFSASAYVQGSIVGK